MSENSPYPNNRHPLGLLDLRPTLRPIATLSATTSKNLKNKHLPPLDYLLMAARLGELYEIVFPHRPEWLEEDVSWNDIEHIGGALEQFLGRVNHIIPVETELMVMDIDMINWRLYSIPVVTQGFDLWLDGWEDFYEPSPYLLLMMHERDSSNDSDKPDEFTKQYPHHVVPAALQPERLVPALRRMNLPEPYNGLPDLICMLNKNVGNFWLDYGEVELAEVGGYPNWDGGEVEILADEWRRALPVCDRVHALLGWNNETPAAIERKVAAIHQTLLAAYHLDGNARQLEMQFVQEAICDRNTPRIPAFAA